MISETNKVYQNGLINLGWHMVASVDLDNNVYMQRHVGMQTHALLVIDRQETILFSPTGLFVGGV